MAMIQIIRNKLGPAIVIIIGLSLGLFVLQTALNAASVTVGNGFTVTAVTAEDAEQLFALVTVTL